MRYWIGVASQDHVSRGVAGGFCQLCHGKAAPLKRMAPGDWIIYYSPKEAFEGNTPLQAFTAIGEVAGEEVYPFEMSPGFVPYRRDIRFLARARPAAIRPLLDRLSFIQDKSRWGYAFRFGHIEIPRADFDLIAQAMLGKEAAQRLVAPDDGGADPAASRAPRTAAAREPASRKRASLQKGKAGAASQARPNADPDPEQRSLDLR